MLSVPILNWTEISLNVIIHSCKMVCTNLSLTTLSLHKSTLSLLSLTNVLPKKFPILHWVFPNMSHFTCYRYILHTNLWLILDVSQNVFSLFAAPFLILPSLTWFFIYHYQIIRILTQLYSLHYYGSPAVLHPNLITIKKKSLH